MFRISNKKGFQIEFPNGYGISVQFGPANYCENYDRQIGKDEEDSGKCGSATAETAILGPEGLVADPNDGEDADTVQGYQTVEQVMERMIRVYGWSKPVPPR